MTLLPTVVPPGSFPTGPAGRFIQITNGIDEIDRLGRSLTENCYAMSTFSSKRSLSIADRRPTSSSRAGVGGTPHSVNHCTEIRLRVDVQVPETTPSRMTMFAPRLTTDRLFGATMCGSALPGPRTH